MTGRTITTVAFILLIFCSVSVQMSSVVYSSTSQHPDTPTLPHRVYMPVIAVEKNLKLWSGVHLGNKSRDSLYEWSNFELQRIDPDDAQYGGNAKWPAIIVVLSDQIFDIHRSYLSPCRIEKATVRLPKTFDYLKRATQAGSKVIIRLSPSPGNFLDWKEGPESPNYRKNHKLIADYPVGGDFCNPTQYRSPLDLADEVQAIHKINLANGWIAFGYEPANEPNIEWYDSTTSRPENFKPEAWDDMNAYFSKIYELSDGVRIFTPPMAQSQFADGIDLNSCQERFLYSEKGEKITGYERMQELLSLKSHGFSWHNYWDYGREAYTSCSNGGNHISYHFPQWLKDMMKNLEKPIVLTEVDLNSQIQSDTSIIKDKHGSDAIQAANSLRHFLDSEWRYGGHVSNSHYGVEPSMALWLLNDNTCREEQCPSDNACLQNFDPNAPGYCMLDHN